MESLTKTEALNKINEILTKHFDWCCDVVIKGLTYVVHQGYYLKNRKFAEGEILVGLNPVHPDDPEINFAFKESDIDEILFLWKNISPKNKYNNLHKCTKNFDLWLNRYNFGIVGETISFIWYSLGKTKTLKRFITRVKEGLTPVGIKVKFKQYKDTCQLLLIKYSCNVEKDYRPNS
ncbi:MAG: hypothetical protein IJ308_04200 [Clostridia bacterium]|nr:hypothetical protein [Clostridia bacterium]